jgi:hypothetical protein
LPTRRGLLRGPRGIRPLVDDGKDRGELSALTLPFTALSRPPEQAAGTFVSPVASGAAPACPGQPLHPARIVHFQELALTASRDPNRAA